jgi:uncharacterized protein
MKRISGTEKGQRELNGIQTRGGRTYRNLSVAEHERTCDEDVEVPMRDGVTLLADVHRPTTPGKFPVLIAASPYPRQIQNTGAPMGFIEAGQTDFLVPRGYVHVIANLRGTSGSGGTFGFFDGQERRDMYDLVEWAAAQPWSDGNVGMIGISYFAMTQLEAAVEQPPHLRAIFPVGVTADLYDAATHNGLTSSSFVTPFLSMVGLTSRQTNKLWRSRIVDIATHILHTPALHKKFETANGEAAMTGLRTLLKFHHDPHPWDDLWRAITAEHPTRDAWWDDRNLLPLLHKVNVPVYLGCDWDNVPLHLPSTFTVYRALTSSPDVRMTLLGSHGLSWPWESLHVEALAWFDHWLKGRDTQITDGPAVTYWMPGAQAWHELPAWPPAATSTELALRTDGVLATDEGPAGERTYFTLGAGTQRVQPSEADPPASLTWTSEPLTANVDMVGAAELRLEASLTAPDGAWIAVLEDVDAAGQATMVTAAYLRASLRAVTSDEPLELDCRKAELVPIGEPVTYRLPFVTNARRFVAGHRIRVRLTSDDQAQDVPLGFRHANVGGSYVARVLPSSRLCLPIV